MLLVLKCNVQEKVTEWKKRFETTFKKYRPRRSCPCAAFHPPCAWSTTIELDCIKHKSTKTVLPLFLHHLPGIDELYLWPNFSPHQNAQELFR
jgi:hypothetical protein